MKVKGGDSEREKGMKVKAKGDESENERGKVKEEEEVKGDKSEIGRG